jgi:hypothetical protein
MREERKVYKVLVGKSMEGDHSVDRDANQNGSYGDWLGRYGVDQVSSR